MPVRESSLLKTMHTEAEQRAAAARESAEQLVRQHDLERHMLAHASDGDSSPEKERQHRAKLEAARAVGYRESLLMQLNAVVIHWPKKSDKGSGPGASNRHEEAARLLENLSGELREAGMACVEKIVAWVLAVSEHASRPKPFWWNGKDYLVKVTLLLLPAPRASSLRHSLRTACSLLLPDLARCSAIWTL